VWKLLEGARGCARYLGARGALSREYVTDACMRQVVRWWAVYSGRNEGFCLHCGPFFRLHRGPLMGFTRIGRNWAPANSTFQLYSSELAILETTI
jgi:hypothetical protein